MVRMEGHEQQKLALGWDAIVDEIEFRHIELDRASM